MSVPDDSKIKYLRIPIPFIGMLLIAPDSVISILYYCIYAEAIIKSEEKNINIREACKEVESRLGLQRRGFDALDFETLEKCHKWYKDVNTNIWAYCPIGRFLEFALKAGKRNIPDFEVNQFCCFLAMKSIEGNKAYGIATKKMILTRMLGLDKSEKLKDSFLSRAKKKEIKEKYQKISTIRKFASIIGGITEGKYFASVAPRPRIGYIFSTNLSIGELTEQYIKDKNICKSPTLDYNRNFFKNAIEIARNSAG